MPIETLDIILDQLTGRINNLQREYVSLQEQKKDQLNANERALTNAALKIIDILELIDLSKVNLSLEGDAALIINKISKRLTEILKHWEVQEIVFPEGKVIAGKARVLETRPSETMTESTGTILEICRKGYQYKDRVIRSADVISIL